MEYLCWREVSRGALFHNFEAVKRLSPAPLCCVVKANGYGHGAVPLGRLYEAFGASYLAVATWKEGLHLRQGGIRLPILILGVTPPKTVPVLEAASLTQSVGSLALGEMYDRYAKGKLPVHLQIDTGMGRAGFRKGAEYAELEAVFTKKHLSVEGIYTHFATADMGDGIPYLHGQTSAFEEAIDYLEQRGHSVGIRHGANSAMLLRGYVWDMPRVGILLYGYPPSHEIPCPLDLQPAMSLYGKIVGLRWVEAGESVGYGATWKSPGRRLIATLPLGYADGIPRCTQGFRVLVRGIPAPVVGRICMDQCMCDVTEVPGVSLFDTATVFGGESTGADALAGCCHTIPYEILTGIGERIPTVYTP